MARYMARYVMWYKLCCAGQLDHGFGLVGTVGLPPEREAGCKSALPGEVVYAGGGFRMTKLLGCAYRGAS